MGRRSRCLKEDSPAKYGRQGNRLFFIFNWTISSGKWESSCIVGRNIIETSNSTSLKRQHAAAVKEKIHYLPSRGSILTKMQKNRNEAMETWDKAKKTWNGLDSLPSLRACFWRSSNHSFLAWWMVEGPPSLVLTKKNFCHMKEERYQRLITLKRAGAPDFLCLLTFWGVCSSKAQGRRSWGLYVKSWLEIWECLSATLISTNFKMRPKTT